MREAVAKLRCGKAPSICNINPELIKAGGEDIIHELHTVLTAVCQLALFFLTKSGAWSFLSGKVKGVRPRL